MENRMGAFNIEGVDLKEGTVLVEISKSLIGPMSGALVRIRPNGRSNVHLACRALGEQLRNAGRVLYGEQTAEYYRFDHLDPIKD